MNFECACSKCDTAAFCDHRQETSELALLQRAANVSRGLVMDMVRQCASGHLGMSLGCAEIGAALFGKCLRFSPQNPRWIDRDRFVLSAGHGTPFLYSWMHLAGFPVSLEDLKHFRQERSVTTGHPEFSPQLGIESTTGPLGQGVANAVGMAVSQKILASQLNSFGELLQGKVVCLAGDGCLQEGVALEALQLAGHWNLNHLILIYDANGVTLDGSLAVSQSHNVRGMFEAFHWQVQEIDGNDISQILQAYRRASIAENSPQLILAHTLIGSGIPQIQACSKAHGNEAGLPHIDDAKAFLGLSPEFFFVPEDIRDFFELQRSRRENDYATWSYRYEVASEMDDSLRCLFTRQTLPAEELIEICPPFSSPAISTRDAAAVVLNEWAKRDGRVLSGSADLFSSTKNYLKDFGDFSAENPSGRNLWFGVREHAMGGILNGIAYDGIFRGVGSTFLVFADYLRPAIRVAALAKLPVIYVFPHDSLVVGEDGPTHQPVETIPALRAIPHLDVVRPADGEETVGAYALAIQNENRPTALILSRQALPLLGNVSPMARRDGVLKGGYILKKESAALGMILIATGSEVALALEAAVNFPDCRVISMPCREAFERQASDYRQSILPDSCRRRFVLEAARSLGWDGYAPRQWQWGVEDFGESMNGAALLKKRGFSLESLRKKLAQLRIWNGENDAN